MIGMEGSEKAKAGGRSQNATRQVVKARFIPSNCPLCGNHLRRDIFV
jgi:hypothetical protein